MDRRASRSPARFLAPLALIAFAIVFVSVLNSSGSKGKDDSGSKSAATTTAKQAGGTSTTTAKTSKPKAKKPKTYTIQAGDTLGSIAEKSGVPLTTIMELNPQVDSNALTTGQKIKLEE
jgi:LysM repeat protein